MTDGSDASTQLSESLLDAVVRHAARLGETSPTPLTRMRMQVDSVTVEIEWSQPAAGPSLDSAARAHPEQATDPIAAPNTDTAEDMSVCAPTVGTFYRAPEPGAPPFAEIGDSVVAGQQLAILEAMKLMNPIEAEQAGKVLEILVPDGTPVEYGQPLLVLAPAGTT